MMRRCALALALLVGCDGELLEPRPEDPDTQDTAPPDDTDAPEDTDEPEPEGPLQMETYRATSDGQGLLRVPVQVEADTVAFMVTGQSDQWVGVEKVLDGQGQVVLHWEDWWYEDYSLTWAFFAYDKTTAFNWPARGVDGPLTPGEWTVELWISDADGQYYNDGAEVDITIHRKTDPDLTQGTVAVDIWYADGVDDEPGVPEAVEQAVERWQEVWAPYGLTLQPTFRSTSLDPGLGFTYTGSDQVAVQAEVLDPGQLVLIVGERVDGSNSTYGVAGGIPGTLAASPLTYTVISWLAHAGQDGAFQPQEVRLMGETMAHELGHYMGLFHPVESNYGHWDSLTDTPSCNDWQSCEDQLGTNLMYPYSICSGNTCTPQDQLTPQQQQVSHLYTGTL